MLPDLNGLRAPRNADSEIVVVRQGQSTVLTMTNDVVGDLTDFGMVVPVPKGVGPESVSVVDPAVLEALRTYTSPRLVSYDCSDIVWIYEDGEWVGQTSSSAGCGGGGNTAPTFEADTGATSTADHGGLGEGNFRGSVETEHFNVGEYDLTVVDAAGEGGLMAWLGDNGFTLSEDASALLGEYIDQGMSFMVVRVLLEELPEDRPWLSPIQVRYSSDVVSIPIRLGTLSSTGQQDVVITTLAESGMMAISTYDQVEPEAECMLADGEDVAVHLDTELDEALTTPEGEAGFALEYGWGSQMCDPCPPTGALDPLVVQALGFEGDANLAYVTRLHMRYTPEQITGDRVLYETGIQSNFQLRYVQYAEEMESYWPVCGQGWIDDPGSCPEPEYDTGGASEATSSSSSSSKSSSGCTRSALMNPLVVLAFVGWARRRRSQRARRE